MSWVLISLAAVGCNHNDIRANQPDTTAASSSASNLRFIAPPHRPPNPRQAVDAEIRRRLPRLIAAGYRRHNCPVADLAIDGYPVDSGSTPRYLRLAVHAQCFRGPHVDLTLRGGRRIVTASYAPEQDTFGQRLFFFDHRRLVGTDTTGRDRDLPMEILSVTATGPDTFDARYLLRKPVDRRWKGHDCAFPLPAPTVDFSWQPGDPPRALDTIPTPGSVHPSRTPLGNTQHPRWCH